MRTVLAETAVGYTWPSSQGMRQKMCSCVSFFYGHFSDSNMEESSSPVGMELALFQAYVMHTTPRLLDKTGVYVVQPNGLQNHLRDVFKIGKGQLRQRFRMYKQMWPDGGKVFAFFTVPTASASWAMQRSRSLASSS